MIDSVPLIQNANDAQQINASIIAMKKASRELDEKIVKLNSLNSELDKKIALLDSGLNKEIEDRKEAINSLDVASVGGSGKYISAISETDGKISATAGDITSSVSSGNSQPVTSGGVASAIAPLQPIDSVTSNLRPVTSGAVYNALQSFNLLPYRSGKMPNVNVYHYIDAEGYILAYPTNSDPRNWDYSNTETKFMLANGNYTLKIEGTAITSSFRAILADENENVYLDKTTSGEFDFTINDTKGYVNIGLIAKLYSNKIRFKLYKQGAYSLFSWYCNII